MAQEIQLIYLGILLILSAFFSGVETALVSVTRLQVKRLVRKEVKGAKTLQKLKEKPHRMLITILIGNNLVNIASASLATIVAIDVFGSLGVGVATGAITFFILVFGEITPKSFATQNSEKIALFAAPLIELLALVLTPIVWFLEIITRFILKLLGTPDHQTKKLTEDDVRSIVSLGAEEGAIPNREKEMIQKIFKFDEKRVEDVLTPKVEVELIDANTKINDLKKILSNTVHSRFPVYEGDEENIIGILILKDYIRALNKNQLNTNVGKISRDAYFVPSTKKIDKLLTEFQTDQISMAIVLNEFGGVEGIVTVEDLVEEIVGEIFDETDHKHTIKKLSENEWLVRGRTELDDIEAKLKIKFDEKELTTISGLILKKLDRIPNEGEKITIGNLKITIESVSKNRITKLRIQKI